MNGDHKHILITVYRRSWWKLFRKHYEVRCFLCNVVVKEPR